MHLNVGLDIGSHINARRQRRAGTMPADQHAAHRRVRCTPRLADRLPAVGMHGAMEPHASAWRFCRGTCYRLLHGGVGNLGLPAATSSGQTTTCLPSIHWMVMAL